MLCADDPIYSAVKGGCSLANLTEFDQVFRSFFFASDRSSFPVAPADFFKSKRAPLGVERYFYTRYLSWFDYLNAGRKDYKVTVKSGSQYDTTRAMRGVKRLRVRRNRLGFNSCVSCVHTLRCIVNQA